MKPATPLPWKMDVQFGTSKLARITGTVNLTGDIVVNTGTGTTRDAAYIVHACNSLPALVAALQAIADRVPSHVAGDGATETARRTLREFGYLAK